MLRCIGKQSGGIRGVSRKEEKEGHGGKEEGIAQLYRTRCRNRQDVCPTVRLSQCILLEWLNRLQSIRKYGDTNVQEAQLSPRDRAMRLVS